MINFLERILNPSFIPEGCQMVAGGRSVTSPERPPELSGKETAHPGGMPEVRPGERLGAVSAAILRNFSSDASNWHSRRRSGIPPGCSTHAILPVVVHSAASERPPATFWHPFGMNATPRYSFPEEI